MLDSESGGPESFGILHMIHRAKINSCSAVVFDLLLHAYHVVACIDPDHVYKMRVKTDRSLELTCGEQEAAITGDREHLLVRTHDGGGDCPGKCYAQRLLAVANQKLARAKAEEIAGQIDAEAAHVRANGHVRR